MARNKVPSLRRHKGSGQGVVTLGGRDVYCGPWPTGLKTPPPEVEDRYRRAVGEWLSAGFNDLGSAAAPATQARPAPSLTVSEVLAKFLAHAQKHYVGPDCKPTSQLEIYKLIMRTVRRLYGETPAAAFGPLCLRAVREDFIRQGMTRTTVNGFTSKTRSIFRWACSHEMLPAGVAHGLDTVAGLQPGRSEARETPPVTAPPEEIITNVINAMPSPLRELATVLRHSGARCGEIRIMRAADLDRSGPVWIYTPSHHKGQWRGKARTIHLGQTCQSALRPLLEGAKDTDFIFSPRRAEAIRLAERAAGRKTPRWPSHMKRNAAKRKPARRRAPGEAFSTTAVGHVMRRAAGKAHPLPAAVARAKGETGPAWRERIGPAGVAQVKEHARKLWIHPHVLRHEFGGRVRQTLGLDSAQRALGHSSPAMTNHYAQVADTLAREAAAKLG